MSETEASTPGPFTKIRIGGNPSGAEVAAIVAALEAAWPKPVVSERSAPATGAWRMSGRWWSTGRLPNSWAVRQL